METIHILVVARKIGGFCLEDPDVVLDAFFTGHEVCASTTYRYVTSVICQMEYHNANLQHMHDVFIHWIHVYPLRQLTYTD